MEFEELKKRFDNVVTIKINRTNYDDGLSDEERAHITETELMDYTGFDYEVDNEDVLSLKEYAKDIVELEENSNE